MIWSGHTRWSWPSPSPQNIIFSIRPLALPLQPWAGGDPSCLVPHPRPRGTKAQAKESSSHPQLPVRWGAHAGMGQRDEVGYACLLCSYFEDDMQNAFFLAAPTVVAILLWTWHSLGSHLWRDKTRTRSSAWEVPMDTLRSHIHPK